MSLVTGALSDSNYALLSSEKLQKQVMKDMYSMLIEFMGLDEKDALSYLQLIQDAVSELIIEQSSQHLSIVDLGVVQGELFGTGNSGTGGNIAGTERENSHGRENSVREIDSSPSDAE